jgi:acyl-homoserine lactone acylase PvdQ
MPGEYAAIGRPLGPDPWKQTDIIAIAGLVGGIFGKGGGEELSWALLLQDFQRRFGRARGTRLWRDFLAAHDPDAPTTVHRGRFPYETLPRRVARGSVAMPDPGSHEPERVLVDGVANPPNELQPSSVTGLKGILGPRSLPRGNSNALLVSARESASGRPIAVFGPQTSYFAPQILMEQDIHGPGIDARGASFPGVNLYVQLGRGRDYAWSATSAGQDNIDVFAVDLCEPGGAAARKASMHYVFRGRCEPIEVLERRNSWTPNAADSTPAGSQTLRALRTKLGIVIARAAIGGTPVAYVRLRSTYFHEVDSAGGFADFNNPDRMRSARDFQRAAYRIGYTFNWFYADDRQISCRSARGTSGRASTRTGSPPATRRSPSTRGSSTRATSRAGTTSRRRARRARRRTSTPPSTAASRSTTASGARSAAPGR